MPTADYNSAAGGPSVGADIMATQAANTAQTNFDYKNLGNMTSRLNAEESAFAKPQLESSLGATGQFNSGAARMSEAHQAVGFQNQRDDLATSFGRAQMDMQRQATFAALGIIL